MAVCKVLDTVEVSIEFRSKGKVVLQQPNIVFVLGYGFVNDLPIFLDRCVAGLGDGSEVTMTSLTKSDCIVQHSPQISPMLAHAVPCDPDTEWDCQCHVVVKKVHPLPKFWELTEEEKVEGARKLKLLGNASLERGALTPAYECYRASVKYLADSLIVRSDQDPTAKQLLVSVYLNAALCQMKCGMFQPCIELCKKALVLEPSNAKALFRLGKAHLDKDEPEEALKTFKRMLELRVEVPLATQQIRHCQTLLAIRKQQEKARCVELFQKLAQSKFVEEKEEEPFPVGVWSNELASEMMPLSEELRAFGETMPERKATRGLDTIDDAGEQSA